ncbi:response regulator transcription factor (plasmid) [Streptomyces sp. BI20]|uniref:response regulator transcription factor n=1 Tax=Streptomyces sp. BI20 TaxID=3403460 RepID=UPI003C755636
MSTSPPPPPRPDPPQAPPTPPPEAESFSVVIADDHALIRSGMRVLLDAEDSLEVVGEAENGAEALTLVTTHRPDVVLMDLHMPEMDGIEATRRMMRLPNPPRVLILTSVPTDDRVVEALEAGAAGFILKDLRSQELLSALLAVARGVPVLAPSAMGGLLRRASVGHDALPGPGGAELRRRFGTLNESERRVLDLLGQGMPNAAIAARLHLSEASVKTYVSRGISKLGLTNRIQAALVAHDLARTSVGATEGR